MNKVIFCFMGLFFLADSVAAEPTVKITLKVVDENNRPIEGAGAGLTFVLPGKGLSTKTEGDRGITDSDGLFTGSGESPQYVDYGANKAGYYGTGGKIRMKKITGILGFRRWEPWNPVIDIVLKKKINPIPMYAHRMDSVQSEYLPEIPVLDRFVGYDLIERDWVVPYGLGTHKDFLFKLEIHRFVNMFEHNLTLTLRFSNEDDGIQSYFDKPNEGSVLRSPHNAPSKGYESEIVVNRNRTRTKRFNVRDREDQNYIFRIRTKLDDKGQVESALYGKIYGNVRLDNVNLKDKTGTVRFNYYLNPKQNDTNIEFDIEKNLFKDLRANEEVTVP